MQRKSRTTIFLLSACLAATGALSAIGTAQSEDSPEADVKRIKEHSPATVDEARARARILYETVHGALQVMHRDFFREDEALKIPSHSLEDVFAELAQMYGVRLRWIAVDLKAMNIDNEPKTEFEKEAVRILKEGKTEHESATADEFRYVGRVRLSATCLACHASRRSSNDDRAAGLVISMPLQQTE